MYTYRQITYTPRQKQSPREVQFRGVLKALLTFSLLTICLFFMQTQALAATSNTKYYSILNSMQEDLNYAKAYYEIDLPNFIQMSREAETPLRTIKSPRYKQDADGIYRSSTVKKDNVAVIMFTGDLMCQKKQQWAAVEKYGEYEFADNFIYVKDILSSADFTVGNLETMLSESATYFGEENLVDGKPHCNAPSTFLDAVRGAGFDMVVTANNHECDTGVQGIFETMAHLDQYKLIHTGTFTNTEQKRYKIVEIDGIKVGFLSYSTLYNGKNAHYTQEGQDVLLNAYSKSRAMKDIAAAKAYGAEYIITYIHWGIEYDNSPSDKQRQIAKELANAGTDYIIGSHPHCLQPYDQVTASDGRRVPVIYSLGNFVSQMRANSITQESMILKIKLKRNSKGEVVLKSDGYIPCRIMPTYKGNNYTCLPLTSPYNQGFLSKYAKDAYPHIVNVVSDKLNIMGRFDIKCLTIKQGYKTTTYSGMSKTPRITLKDGLGQTLVKNVDYTVTRSNNKLPGISTITVKGIGRYTGTWKGTLTIEPRKVTKYKVTQLSDGRYRFTWKADKGVDGYYIYVKSPGKKTYRMVRTITSAECTFKNTASASGTYYVKIAAYKETSKGTLVSAKSDALSFYAKKRK